MAATITWATATAEETVTLITDYLDFSLSGNTTNFESYKTAAAAEAVKAIFDKYDGYQYTLVFKAGATNVGHAGCVVVGTTSATCIQVLSETTSKFSRGATPAEVQGVITDNSAFTAKVITPGDGTVAPWKGFDAADDKGTTGWTATYKSFIPIATNGAEVRFEKGTMAKGSHYKAANAWTDAAEVELKGAVSLAAAAAVATAAALAF